MSDCLAGLTADQRRGAYILSAVDTLQTQVNTVEASVTTLDNETFVDNGNYNYVSSTTSMDYDATKKFNTLVGVDGGCIGDGNCEGTTILGSRARVQNGDYNIAIGANANIVHDGLTEVNRVNRNIVIGANSRIRNPTDAAEVKANITVGHDNQIDNGSNNIVLGNSVGHGLQINNCIVIAQKPLTAIVPNTSNGSVIISAGSAAPSALPKLQFLGDGLTNLRGQNAGDVVQVAAPVPFALGNINGYLRMKYKGVNLMLPFILDDDLNPANNPV